MFVPEDKIIFLIIFLFLLFTSCNNKKNELSDIAQKIVLVDSVSEKFRGSLDSMVFLYQDMKNKKTRVIQSDYYHGGEEPLIWSYYLTSDNKYLYASRTSVRDTICFFPYCSFALHDTIYYDIDKNSKDEYLNNYCGYTVFTNKLDSNRKEYTGGLLTFPPLSPEDSTVKTKWVLDDSNRIESICIVPANFVRKSSEFVKLPERYYFPKDRFTNVFIYNENRQKIIQKINALIQKQQNEIY